MHGASSLPLRPPPAARALRIGCWHRQWAAMGPRDPIQGASRALEALEGVQLVTRLLSAIESAYNDVGAGRGTCRAALGTDGALAAPAEACRRPCHIVVVASNACASMKPPGCAAGVPAAAAAACRPCRCLTPPWPPSMPAAHPPVQTCCSTLGP